MSSDELTATLSEKNRNVLFLGPSIVGGDSMDMEFFLENVWQKPVTDDNLHEVVTAFKKWYAEVAPDESHPPVKPFWLDDDTLPAPWTFNRFE